MEPQLGHSGSVRHTCGGSEGCMCVYDPELNPNLKARRLVALDEVIDALNDYYHPQTPRTCTPLTSSPRGLRRPATRTFAMSDAQLQELGSIQDYPWTRYCPRCGIQLWLNGLCGICPREGDWMCECGWVNNVTWSECEGCGAKP